MKLFVSIPSRYSELLYKHKGTRSPAVFVLDAIKFYADHLDSSNTSNKENISDERNKNTVRPN